jgi:thiaminase (transcriptional activator TenA)
MSAIHPGGAQSSGLADRLFEAGAPFVEAQLRHPTVRALQDGRLADAAARYWLEQDYLFLQAETAVLARLAWQAPRQHRAELLRLAWNVVDREIPEHRSLSAPFGADLDHAEMGLATLSYTRWLTGAAADYGVGLTALLSGLWGYSTLGRQLEIPSEPRFRRWVVSYQSPEFPALAERFAAMVDEVAPDPAPALGAFLTGMAHEIAFWTVPPAGSTRGGQR